MFIFERDYLKIMRRAHLVAAIDGDTAVRVAAEQTAIQEAAGYLARARFDAPAIFKDIPAWAVATAYVAGNYVHYEPALWTAQAYAMGTQLQFTFADGTYIVESTRLTTPMETPATTPAAWVRRDLLLGIWKCTGTPVVGTPPIWGSINWVQEDPRHRLVVMYVTDIAIWHMLSRTDPSALPEQRVTRYEQAIAWLNAVSKGQVSDPYLPLISGPGEVPLSGIYVSGPSKQDFNL